MRSIDKPVHISRSKVISTLLFILLVFHAPAAMSLEWEIEIVDDGKMFSEMTDRSLCLDADDNPHIAYGSGSSLLCVL